MPATRPLPLSGAGKDPGPPGSTLNPSAGAALVFLLYLVTGRLGVLLAMPPGLATAIWVPSGIALAGVCLWGYRIWPAIWLASFGLNAFALFDSSSLSRAVLTIAALGSVATGSTLQALVAAAFLRRFQQGPAPWIETVTGVFRFAIAAAVSCVVAATFGALTLTAGGFAPVATFGPTWLTWWLGDLVGMLTVTTIWLTWRSAPSFRDPRRMVEAAALLAAMVGHSVLLFELEVGRAFLMVPMTVWAAIRFGAWGTAWTVALLTAMVTAGTVAGRGPFASPMPYQGLLLLQGFFGTLLVTGLAIAGAFSERRRAEAAVREAEARTRAMLESSLDAIVTIDHQGRIVEWNPAAQRLFGYPRGFALGKAMADLVIPPALRERHRSSFRRHLETGERSILGRQVEMPALRADGTEFPAEIAIAAVAAPGEPMFTGFIRDISERKAAEKALRAWNQVLEEEVAARTAEARRRAELLQALTVELSDAEERERRRVAQILHDQIQQLLVAARMRIQLLSRRAPGPELAEFIRAADELIDQAIRESRMLTSELSPPVLHEAGLEGALEWLVRWMKEKYGLDAALEVRGDLDKIGDGLAVLLFRAVRELLFNVSKHAGVDRASVVVERSGWSVRAVVEDRGRGIDHAATVQQPGQAPSHFGLFGLQERVAYLGGRVTIEGTPGQGTRVTLVVPIEHAPVGRTAEPSPEAAPVLPEASTKPIRVVIADDHRMVREGMAELLHRWPDIEIVGQAPDGRSAVDLAETLKPDVVVMDVTMPGMNGIEATRLIRSARPETQIVGVSVHVEADLAASMRRAGAVAYLEKDSAPEVLVGAIRSAARRTAAGVE